MSQTITGIITWLKDWFYDKDDVDDIIENIPLGLTSITLVPYSENPDGVICYDSSDTPIPVVVDSVTLVSNKSILSAYDSETATLTATVLDEDSQPISSVSVEFFNGSTSLGTANTNSSGVATKTYTANGSGDISVTAECGLITSTPVSIEDCIYYNTEENSVTRSGTTIYGYWNDDKFSNLPSKYLVEFDMKTSTAPSSNAEQRIFWCPTNQWGGTGSQPSNAVFVGYSYSSGMKFNYGKRISGTTSGLQNISATANNWDTVKIEKVSTEKCDFYYNGTYRDYYSFTNMESYSEFALTYIMWSNTTFSIKNIKIKVIT